MHAVLGPFGSAHPNPELTYSNRWIVFDDRRGIESRSSEGGFQLSTKYNPVPPGLTTITSHRIKSGERRDSLET